MIRRFPTLLFLVLCACSGNRSQDPNDVTDGIARYYRVDGTLLTEVTMKDGMKNGLKKSYYKSGKLNVIENFMNDQLDGVARHYYENGNLMKETPYTKGVIDGTVKKYREDGKVAWEAPMKNELSCKGLKEYYLDGRLKTEYPSVVFTAIDDVRGSGEFTLRVSMSDNSNADFYLGKIETIDCFDLKKLNYLTFKPEREFKFKYHLMPGQFMMEEISVIARIKTQQGNYYFTGNTYHLALSN